ncbi:MAG: hypothetical protein Tsb0026_12710 [Sulfuricaulis sp.]
MCRTKFMACLLAGLLAWVAASPAEARRDGRSPRHESTRQDRFSLDEAVVNVRRDTGGRVLSAQTREQQNGTTYRIKVLLPNASVRSFDVGPQDRGRR